MTALTKVDEISRALVEATDIRDIKRLHDESAVLRLLVKKARLGFDAQQQVAEMQLRIARRAGEMLIQLEDNGTRHTRGGKERAVTLPELGIEKWESSRWQHIARIPDDTFEAYMAGRRGAGEEITTSGLLSKPKGFTGFSSESVEWYSPDKVTTAAVLVLGRIDLDPCAETPGRGGRYNVPAVTHYTEKDDGLSRPWCHGSVYMNPPYGDEIPLWVEKLIEELEAGRTTEAITLTPARTDTAWFRQLAEYDRLVCFVTGRLVFKTPAGREYVGQSATFPSAIMGLGVRRAKFIEVFREMGLIYERVA